MNRLEEEFAHRLTAAVPPTPEPTTWGVKARDRHARSRRRRGAAGAGVASLAIAAALLMPELIGRTETREPSPAPPPVPTTELGLATGCPDPSTSLAYPAGGRVRDNPVGVWVCNISGDSGTDSDLPSVELTKDPQGIVDLVNELPVQTADIPCEDSVGADVAVWFRYPDGTAQAVRYADYGCHTVTVDEQAPLRGNGQLLGLAAQAQAQAQLIADSEDPDREGDVTVLNRTGKEVWLILPFGNRASIAPGSQTRLLGPCGYRPLRAETEDGTILGYFAGPCRTETWTLTSTEPVPPDDPATSGILTGDLIVNTATGQRVVKHGGITVEGPVTRTGSVDEHGHFEIRLPAGTYTLTGGSTVLPGGTTDYDCSAESAVTVVAQGTSAATVSCGAEEP